MPERSIWRIDSFGGGLVTAADSKRLDESQSPNLQNVVFDRGGSLRRRAGHAPYTSATFTTIPTELFRWTENYLIVVHNGGKITVLKDDGAHPVSSGTSYFTAAGEPVGGYSYNGYFYMHSRLNQTRRIDGSYTSVAVPDHPYARYSAVMRDIVFLANIRTTGGVNKFSDVWFMDAAAGPEGTWPTTNIIPIHTDDLEQITGIVGFQDRLIVFKTSSLYMIAGHSSEDYIVVPLALNKGGCPYPRTIATAENGIYYFSDDGVKMFDGTQIIPISTLIDPIVGTPVSGAYSNRRYYLTTVDQYGIVTMFVYDTVGKWWSKWNGIPVACLTADFRTGETSQRLYGVSTTQSKVLRLETGSTDNGTDIQAFWESGWMDLGTPEVKKRTRRLYVTSRDESGPLVVEIARNWRDDDVVRQQVSPKPQADHLVMRSGAAGGLYAAKLRVENTNGDDLAVDTIMMSFVPRKVR